MGGPTGCMAVDNNMGKQYFLPMCLFQVCFVYCLFEDFGPAPVSERNYPWGCELITFELHLLKWQTSYILPNFVQNEPPTQVQRAARHWFLYSSDAGACPRGKLFEFEHWELFDCKLQKNNNNETCGVPETLSWCLERVVFYLLCHHHGPNFTFRLGPHLPVALVDSAPSTSANFYCAKICGHRRSQFVCLEDQDPSAGFFLANASSPMHGRSRLKTPFLFWKSQSISIAA